jgi:hypothetical protein
VGLNLLTVATIGLAFGNHGIATFALMPFVWAAFFVAWDALDVHGLTLGASDQKGFARTGKVNRGIKS